jgi:hypothetical protein
MLRLSAHTNLTFDHSLCNATLQRVDTDKAAADARIGSLETEGARHITRIYHNSHDIFLFCNLTLKRVGTDKATADARIGSLETEINSEKAAHHTCVGTVKTLHARLASEADDKKRYLEAHDAKQQLYEEQIDGLHGDVARLRAKQEASDAAAAERCVSLMAAAEHEAQMRETERGEYCFQFLLIVKFVTPFLVIVRIASTQKRHMQLLRHLTYRNTARISLLQISRHFLCQLQRCNHLLFFFVFFCAEIASKTLVEKERRFDQRIAEVEAAAAQRENTLQLRISSLEEEKALAEAEVTQLRKQLLEVQIENEEKFAKYEESTRAAAEKRHKTTLGEFEARVASIKQARNELQATAAQQQRDYTRLADSSQTERLEYEAWIAKERAVKAETEEQVRFIGFTLKC